VQGGFADIGAFLQAVVTDFADCGRLGPMRMVISQRAYHGRTRDFGVRREKLGLELFQVEECFGWLRTIRAIAEGSASWNLQGGMGLHVRGSSL
jgi:hypothetical protein